ncbi:TPA: hypothetical protein N0F65_006077 [Lagenidium giganteum]|uniref:Uncharacterized protein n=1 Tax=Lagenidium giganteum TaxID=4803 RepID=A0AAV2YP70_9STRA|nr:TPA: hypothetical protein N0F65_006077 [Lagenidium giganteum]
MPRSCTSTRHTTRHGPSGTSRRWPTARWRSRPTLVATSRAATIACDVRTLCLCTRRA